MSERESERERERSREREKERDGFLVASPFFCCCFVGSYAPSDGSLSLRDLGLMYTYSFDQKLFNHTKLFFNHTLNSNFQNSDIFLR